MDKIEEYRIKNKYRIQEYAKIYNESYDFSLYNKNRRKDPLYKLKQNTRNLIKNAFLRKFTKKSKKTTEILGCDFNFFSDGETGKHYGFSLPVILWDNGLKVFSSSKFHNP